MESMLDVINSNTEYRKLLNYDVFSEAINNINCDVLFNSEEHGIKHSLRTTLYALYLSDILELDRNDSKLLFLATIYHDIGRINNDKDDLHGKRSANNLDFLDITEDDLNILKAIVEVHSIDDNKMSEVISSYPINHSRAIKLASLLKDCDALDRHRFKNDFEISFIRFDASKSLIKLAQMLCNIKG